MTFDTKLRSCNIIFSIFTFVFAGLGILSYSSILDATDFNGPTELSSKEFKDLNINGPSRLSEIKADSLTIKGPLNFNKLRVKGKAEFSGAVSGEEGEFTNLAIHGTLWGSKIKIDNLHVDGDVSIEDFQITGKVDINGPLKAKNGSFNNITTVETPVALYNVTVNNIFVKQDTDKNRNAKDDSNEVKLAGNTVVSGDITFESGDGVVFIRDKTAKLKGKIIGGKLKEQN